MVKGTGVICRAGHWELRSLPCCRLVVVASVFLPCSELSLCTFQPCWSLRGAKPKWVPRVVPRKAEEAGHSPPSPFSGEGPISSWGSSLLALGSASLEDRMMQANEAALPSLFVGLFLFHYVTEVSYLNS